MPQGLVVDPEFKALIPPLTVEEYNGLQASIIAEGCTDAIVAWNGVIVDGHNRHEICRANNKGFQVRSVQLPDRQAAKEWILTRQLCRRNLNPSQRALLAAQLAERKPGERDSNRQALPISKVPEIAEKTGVSARTIINAKVVLDKGTPAQKAAVRDGKASVSATATAIRHPEPPQAAPAPTAVDQEGHPLPADAPKIAAAFARRAELVHFMSALSTLKGQVLKLAESDPLFARLSTSDFQCGMDRARSALKNAAPHSVCPYCIGDGCKACHKTGWVTLGVWDAAPVESKEAMKP